MSVMDQIKSLDEQRAKLLEGAKHEAISAANIAIKALNELGFKYRLIEDNTNAGSGKTTGTRRTGIRDLVLKVVQDNPGIATGGIITHMDAKGDKQATQSISNALSALKKAGTIVNDGKGFKAK